jgi:Spy/CpxP family protein refolding chaperone
LTRRYLAIAIIALIAGLAGALLGQRLAPKPETPGSELHAMIHDKLDLDAQQRQAMKALGADYARRKAALEQRMRADNRTLAAAIGAEHGDGPRVRAAVDATHHTMGALQKETLRHMFAMRALLRPDQAAKFDAAVQKALTEAPR